MTDDLYTMQPQKIVMYAVDWCPDCRRAKFFFERMKIPYEMVNVDKDERGAEFVKQVNNGMRSVPTIILPDGSSIVIDNLPATDTGGYAGLADEVDLHTWKLLKGVALATVLGVGSELVFGSNDSDLVKALQQSTQATTNRAGQRLIERQLNVQPTIKVRPGWPLRVIVHKDIVFSRPYRGTASN